MLSPGYSKTPLAKKLGIKTGYHIKLVNAPAYYLGLFTDLPPELDINNNTKHKKNFIHFFTTRGDELAKVLPKLKKEMLQDGMIWVSWPKKSSQTPTSVDENTIREAAVKNGLVDVKVCAINEVWSGLKLVIPLKDRKT